DPDIFRRECMAAGFIVEKTGFFGAVGVDRQAYGALKADMEHVGVIAVKPEDALEADDLPASYLCSTDGSAIHYSVEGRGKTALVFIHGLGCEATYWQKQVQHFRNHYTVITLDLAGHGDSAKKRQRWTIEAFAQDVATVVNHAEIENVFLI